MPADIIIHIRLNVEKINKKWLFKGEKGTYLDATVFFNNEQDDYESNGMIVQSVPTDVYKKEKADGVAKKDMTKGEILGNCKVWGSGAGDRESVPGSESSSKKGGSKKKEEEELEIDDDLPF
jgi:hypothetical protein